MARRQDRKVIKIEVAYGSDRQKLIVKRNYDLRVRDVQEDAARAFKIPIEQLILYWKVNKLFLETRLFSSKICFRVEIFVIHRMNFWKR